MSRYTDLEYAPSQLGKSLSRRALDYELMPEDLGIVDIPSETQIRSLIQTQVIGADPNIFYSIKVPFPALLPLNT